MAVFLARIPVRLVRRPRSQVITAAGRHLLRPRQRVQP
jgi:hypothetical protein